MQEALLLAIDEMFRSSRTPELPGRLASKNYCRLARMIDEHVVQHTASAIYSADLAEHCAAFHQTASQTLGSRGRNRLILATMWRAYPRVRRRWPRTAAALRALAA